MPASDLPLGLIIMYHWILLLTLAGLIQGQAIISRPKGVTEKTGGSAEFECKVDFTGSIHTMQWLFGDQIIYAYEKGKEDFPMGSKKYAVLQDGRTFNLTVKELDLTDGGKYTCIVVTDSASALLIVLDTPQLLTPKPDKVEGTTAQFTCKAKFSGPSEEDDFPGLQMSIGGDQVVGTIHLKEPEALTDFYQYTKVFNITLESSMNGNKLKCEFNRTSNPALHVYNTTEIRVLYPVCDINYSPVSEEYEIGAVLICTADGNPKPEIVWDDIRNNENSITGNSLKVSKEMMGSNTWRCTASNTINGQPYHNNVVAVFETVSPADNAGASLGIGLGVTFAVCALVTVLILVYVFVWRKKTTQTRPLALKKTGNQSESQWEKKSADGIGTKESENTDPKDTETQVHLLSNEEESHENKFQNDIVSEMWLHTDLSSEKMQELLKEDGRFLITYHENQAQPYKVSYLWFGEIKHIWIKFDMLKRVWTLDKMDEVTVFKNVSDLVVSLPGREVTVNGDKVKFTNIVMRKEQETNQI